MGGETPETYWPTNKRQVINLWNCCILLVDLFESYDEAQTCELQIRLSIRVLQIPTQFSYKTLCIFLTPLSPIQIFTPPSTWAKENKYSSFKYSSVQVTYPHFRFLNRFSITDLPLSPGLTCTEYGLETWHAKIVEIRVLDQWSCTHAATPSPVWHVQYISAFLRSSSRLCFPSHFVSKRPYIFPSFHWRGHQVTDRC
jgi:hypothetical protein